MFCEDNEIIYASPNDEVGFPAFGDKTSISRTISNLSINTNKYETYYVYLWVDNNSKVYPELSVAEIQVNYGEVFIYDHNGEIVKTIEDSREVIDKVEIEDVNLNLKVGEAPTFSANIKNNDGSIKLIETFLSLDRASVLTTDEEFYSYEDVLVKDLKYIHVLDLEILESANKKFDETTKFFINGVKTDPVYMSAGAYVIFSDESEIIYPEGYIEPAELDEDFEEVQRQTNNEIILQAIKDGKVTYNEEETKNAVQDALENGGEIEVELYVSNSFSRSLAQFNYYNNEGDSICDEVLNAFDEKLEEGKNIGAYYYVIIFVYIDGDMVGFISEIETPISVTIPLPNGLPELGKNFERTWNVIRYHNGVAEVLDAVQTENGINFLNGRFSEFATVYEDIEKEVQEEVKNDSAIPEEPAEIKDIKEEEELIIETSPATGDNIVTFVGLIILSLLGIVLTIIKQNRK